MAASLSELGIVGVALATGALIIKSIERIVGRLTKRRRPDDDAERRDDAHPRRIDDVTLRELVKDGFASMERLQAETNRRHEERHLETNRRLDAIEVTLDKQREAASKLLADYANTRSKTDVLWAKCLDCGVARALGPRRLS